jgi:hypothetical protein
MSINNTDPPPINHEDYESRPPSPDLMEDKDEAQHDLDKEVVAVESAESAESIVEARPPVETPAPACSTNSESSPTDPMDELQNSMEKHHLNSMMHTMQANLLSATAKSPQESLNAALGPKLEELDALKSHLMSTKPTVPVQEVHCQVTEESSSKKSASTSANGSASNQPASSKPSSPAPGFTSSATHQPRHPSSATKQPHFSIPTMYEGHPEVGTLCVK